MTRDHDSDVQALTTAVQQWAGQPRTGDRPADVAAAVMAGIGLLDGPRRWPTR